MGTIRFVRQNAPNECGVAALQMIAEFFLCKRLCYQEVRRHCMLKAYGMNIRSLCNAAKLLGLKTLPIWCDAENFNDDIPTPCISIWNNTHYIVITSICQDWVEIINPVAGKLTYSPEYFSHRCFCNDTKKGIFILFEKNDSHFKEKE